MELLIKNGILVTEDGVIKGDLRVQGEKIAEIKPKLEPAAGETVIDASGQLVMPGVIDAHTHYKMFGRDTYTADDFFTGSRSAACGGVTTFIDYADPLVDHDLLASLQARIDEAQGETCLDYHLHMVINGWHSWSKDELVKLSDRGIKNLKVFTTYGSEQLARNSLEQLLKIAKELNMLVTVHAEDDQIVTEAAEALKEKGLTAPAYHAVSRPETAEVKAIAGIIALAERNQTPVYFVHVSTGQGAGLIKEAQIRGIKIYGETCPHYLILTEDYLQKDLAQQYIMSPPLRRITDHIQLWDALKSNALQVVATDHCAYTLDQKLQSQTCFDTLPGIPGSETLLSLLYSEGVAKQRISLEQLVAGLATNPAKIFGLYPQKGVIRPGSDADLVIFDPDLRRKLAGSELHSAAGYTPFEGFSVQGSPQKTILRGQIIYEQGHFYGRKGQGRFITAGDLY